MAATARKTKKKARCMIDGCTNPEARRGLCEGCYRSAYRKIKTGDTSWPQLERDGMARPLAQGGTAFHRKFASKELATK